MAANDDQEQQQAEIQVFNAMDASDGNPYCAAFLRSFETSVVEEISVKTLRFHVLVQEYCAGGALVDYLNKLDACATDSLFCFVVSDQSARCHARARFRS